MTRTRDTRRPQPINVIQCISDLVDKATRSGGERGKGRGPDQTQLNCNFKWVELIEKVITMPVHNLSVMYELGFDLSFLQFEMSFVVDTL